MFKEIAGDGGIVKSALATLRTLCVDSYELTRKITRVFSAFLQKYPSLTSNGIIGTHIGEHAKLPIGVFTSRKAAIKARGLRNDSSDSKIQPMVLSIALILP